MSVAEMFFKLQKFIKLHREGFTDKAIAETLDISLYTVFNWRRSHGLKPNKSKEPKVIKKDRTYKRTNGKSLCEKCENMTATKCRKIKTGNPKLAPCEYEISTYSEKFSTGQIKINERVKVIKCDNFVLDHRLAKGAG